jgi:hypothetical protein
MVYRQLAFVPPTSFTCSNRPGCNLKIPYTGGIPGDKPAVKVLSVISGNIALRLPTGGCGTSSPTSNPPPTEALAASGGFMTLSFVWPNATWCNYSGTVVYELVDHNCGAGFRCTSSNTISVTFKY